MASQLKTSVLMLALVLSALGLCIEGSARADGLDAKGQAKAKEATRLYKQGLYEEAAKLFAALSVDYPDMTIFERNTGACYYYLQRPEPALSNLRNYLKHKPDITPDDEAVVVRWIDDMERLRAENRTSNGSPTTPRSAEMSATPIGAPMTSAPSGNGEPIETSTAPIPTTALRAPTLSVAASQPATAPTSNDLAPQFYQRWWFWGAVGAVVAGTVTAYIAASHSRTENACSGSSLPCDAIK
jgi:hypothetical protein